MGITELFPIVVTILEVIKRFIPNKYRDVSVPALSMATGVGLSWVAGGHTAGLEMLTTGLSAGAAAMGTYSGAKKLGAGLGVV